MDRIAARIELGGETGNAQYDSRSGQVFVAVETRDQLIEAGSGSSQPIVPARKRCPGRSADRVRSPNVTAKAARPNWCCRR